MKKVLSVVLACCLVFTVAATSFAGSGTTLRFNSDGKFKIMVLADVQDTYPMKDAEVEFINEVLDNQKPDLVIFLGDNIVTNELATYDQLLTPLTSRGIPFTFVFGNHDREASGYTAEFMLEQYQKYAGCLAYDADPSLHGCATNNLPILASTSSNVAFNLWMMDSGDYVNDANGNRLGYDCVRKDQIEWFQKTDAALQAANGGEKVYSLLFQHIIPEEPVKQVFVKSPIAVKDVTIDFDDGSHVLKVPDCSKFNGYIWEPSCPSKQNDGEWQALVDEKDVLGVVVGHDHVNEFITDVNGVDLIQTPGVTYNSYYNKFLQGARIIELDENNPQTYSTSMVTTAEIASQKGSKMAGLSGKSQAYYYFYFILGKVMNLVTKLVKTYISNIIH